MIPFDFSYYKPESLQEAVEIFSQYKNAGKQAKYYSGGSEIITMCRAGAIQPDALIDIKGIPECKVLAIDNESLYIGSVVTLNQISKSNLFPLLKLACGRIADHTNQCRITLGGNICGTIIYRETTLPLMLSDAEATLFGVDGERTIPFTSIFQKEIQLIDGEILTHVAIPAWALSAKYAHIKKTANEKIDYPLVSVAALWNNDFMRIAFSGLCSYPFRSEKIEAALNDFAMAVSERIDLACTMLPEAFYSDYAGSSEYREFVLRNTLQRLLEDSESGKI